MDDIRVADGFDTNDLRLLARRAVAVKDALRSLNQPPPFNEPRLVAYLDLLEATPEPTDAELVLAAAREARIVLRAAYVDNLGTEKEPEATAVDRELAALLGDLSEMLQPFGQDPEDEALQGELIEPDGHEIEALQAEESELRRITREVQHEFLGTEFKKGVAASALANLISPLAYIAFIALFIIARLARGQLGQRALVSLLDRQENEISAFEQAVEQNRAAVETVAGLYDKARETIVNARSKIATVRRGIVRIFQNGGTPPLPDPTDPPNSDLPPPDCTTEDGQPGYLLAGTCYPLDTKELKLYGATDFDFAKLAAFRQLTHLGLPAVDPS